MRSFLNKLIKSLNRKSPDAEMIGEVKFRRDNTPFFTVKMRGCKTLIDVDAEDIIEKFTEKFSSTDIKNATKVFMKFRSLLKLVNLEKNLAILHDNKDNRYHIIDLLDNAFFRKIDFDSISAEDTFKLGIQFEKLRIEKDRKLLNLSKSSHNISQLKLVKSND